MLLVFTSCKLNTKVERSQEAENYFMNQLRLAMKNSDSIETNLTNFFILANYDDICITYDKQGDLSLVSFVKRGYFRDTSYRLDVSKYLDIDKSYTRHIRELDPKTGYSAISTLCGNKKGKFIIRKVKNSKDKYIVDTKHNPYKNKYKDIK